VDQDFFANLNEFIPFTHAYEFLMFGFKDLICFEKLLTCEFFCSKQDIL